MKKNLLFVGFCFLASLCLQAQGLEKFTFGVLLSPGVTYANIQDNDATSSGKSIVADGYTTVNQNQLRGFTAKLLINYQLKDNLELSTGLYIGERRINVRNVDGSYVGTSLYHVNYSSIPLLLKFKSDDIKKDLKLVAYLGPTFDFATGEDVIGNDNAHFMYFARNYNNIGVARDRNGNDRTMDLFAKTGVSVLASVGLEYRLTDRFNACFGVSYQHRVTNMLNPDLLFPDKNRTPIAETTKWSSALLSFDFGIGFNLNDL
jgi:hypothetical protein